MKKLLIISALFLSQVAVGMDNSPAACLVSQYREKGYNTAIIENLVGQNLADAAGLCERIDDLEEAIDDNITSYGMRYALVQMVKNANSAEEFYRLNDILLPMLTYVAEFNVKKDASKANGANEKVATGLEWVVQLLRAPTNAAKAELVGMGIDMFKNIIVESMKAELGRQDEQEERATHKRIRKDLKTRAGALSILPLVETVIDRTQEFDTLKQLSFEMLLMELCIPHDKLINLTMAGKAHRVGRDKLGFPVPPTSPLQAMKSLVIQHLMVFLSNDEVKEFANQIKTDNVSFESLTQRGNVRRFLGLAQD